MMNNEYCRYIHTYSELEGLQHAHRLVYCGALSAQGVVMEPVSYTHLTLPTTSRV